MRKIIVSLSRTMEVDDEDLKFLSKAAADGDLQAFHEIAELNWEGKATIIEVSEKKEKRKKKNPNKEIKK